MPGYWNAHSDRDFEDPFGLNETWFEDDGTDPREAALSEAIVALIRATDICERWGAVPHKTSCTRIAADALRRAGRDDLATRCEEVDGPHGAARILAELEGIGMSNLTEFARSELQRAGLFDKDSDYGGMLGEAVMKMMEQFAEEGHSGMSAGMAISLFERLARGEPITPLTGDDDEWNEVAQGQWQNRRCSHVFKDADGRAYDIQGRVFREPNGSCYISRSRVYIEFPYTPKIEYVDVPASDDA